MGIDMVFGRILCLYIVSKLWMLRDLQADHPELTDQHARYDLLAPDFEHSCLNRLQLRNTLEMVDLADQATSLQLVGRLTNPLHGR